MSEEAIYWIFSTLPQVLAALTGLVMAGLSFFDQNLKKEVSNDDTKDVILDPILKKIYRRASIFLVTSIVTIIVDVTVLSYAKTLSDRIQNISYLPSLEALLLLFILFLLIILNGGSLCLIFPILNPVLDPDLRNETRDKQVGKIKADLNLADNDADLDENDAQKNQQGEKKSNVSTDELSSVTPIVFMEYFREFEKAVRRFFPKSSQEGRAEGLTSLVRKLSYDNVISKKEVGEISNIIKLRNLYIHGAEIGDVKTSIIKLLENLTSALNQKFERHMQSLPASEANERFSSWIDDNVEDLDEAYNLEQAIKSKHRYGEYDVLFNGYGLIIKCDNKNTLFLSYNDVDDFLKLLEKKFAKNGYTLEDQKSFEDALRKIKEEEDDDD